MRWTTRRSAGSADRQEIADPFVFLCSPWAGSCVGSTYHIDGGRLNVTT